MKRKKRTSHKQPKAKPQKAVNREKMVEPEILEQPRWFLLNLDEISRIFHQKKWAQLARVVEFAQHDAPLELAATDPALFRALRSGITEYHIRGFGNFNLATIQAFARESR